MTPVLYVTSKTLVTLRILIFQIQGSTSLLVYARRAAKSEEQEFSEKCLVIPPAGRQNVIWIISGTAQLTVKILQKMKICKTPYIIWSRCIDHHDPCLSIINCGNLLRITKKLKLNNLFVIYLKDYRTEHRFQIFFLSESMPKLESGFEPITSTP